MGNRFEATVDRLSGRWVEMVARRPGRVLAVAALFTAAVAVYAALHLGVDADPRSLIDRRLPFQVRQRALTETFHTLGDGILVVIDADSPTAAAHAADALAARLAARADLFTQVDVPGGGPFFARNALLYLDPDQLEDLTDRLGRGAALPRRARARPEPGRHRGPAPPGARGRARRARDVGLDLRDRARSRERGRRGDDRRPPAGRSVGQRAPRRRPAGRGAPARRRAARRSSTTARC